MKKLLILWFSLTCILSNVSAQEKIKEGFLFDQFKNGNIYYQDGRQFINIPLNYNLITHQFVFIDKKDGNQEKEFTEPGMIVAIEIDKRTFLPPSEGATEIIQAEPPFYVSYEGTIRKTKATSYGGETMTASVDTYSQIRGVGTIGGTEGTKQSLAATNKVYKIKVGKKNKRFSSKKDFLKLFPEKKEALEKYIEEQKIDFENVDQVLGLYNYTLRL